MSARTGEWPVSKPVDLEAAEATGEQGEQDSLHTVETSAADEQGKQHLELVRVQARFELVLHSIRADLREQPSEACVRSAARRWCNDIIAAADEVVNKLRSTT